MTNREAKDWIRPIYGYLTRLLDDEVSRGEQAQRELTEADTERWAESMLRDAMRERATDIHFEPQSDGVRLRFRVDGALLDTRLLPLDSGRRLIRHFKATADLDPTVVFRPQDARCTVRVDGHPLDLRLATTPCVYGEKLAIRVLDPDRVMHRLEDLGLSASAEQRIREWLEASAGMFLVCGPTGSGKTTTLYALLHRLKLIERSVVTVEDPVEYRIDGITQMQIRPRQGLTFAEGLKAMLRLDPDYLLVGEIRDEESARAAIEAATSGRILMSTLHSRDAVNVVTALRNWGLADHEIAASLDIVVSQRLVRKLCPNCRLLRPPTDIEHRWAESLGCTLPEKVWQAKGCDACSGRGYLGRTGLFELWRLDEGDYEAILQHVDEHTLRARLREANFHPLLADAMAKLEEGVTTLDELRTTTGFTVGGSTKPSRRP